MVRRSAGEEEVLDSLGSTSTLKYHQNQSLTKRNVADTCIYLDVRDLSSSTPRSKLEMPRGADRV